MKSCSDGAFCAKKITYINTMKVENYIHSQVTKRQPKKKKKREHNI